MGGPADHCHVPRFILGAGVRGVDSWNRFQRLINLRSSDCCNRPTVLSVLELKGLVRRFPGSSEVDAGSAMPGVELIGSIQCLSCRPSMPTNAENWLCFSGSTRPWFGLSHNATTINTIDAASKLALFCRFSFTAISPASHSLATDHRPLATVLIAPRPTSGVRSRGPSPLATAFDRQPNWERANGTRSRRAARLYSVCHRVGQPVRTKRTFPPNTPPPDR